MQNTTEWATIGTIVAPFGIRGELKVRSLTDIPDRFATIGTVYLAPEHTAYSVTTVRPHKGNVVVLRLAGIDDASSAETLRNRDITIPLAQLAQLPSDSYYQHDIIGLRVATLNEREVGTIVDIMETGSNDVYVIKATDGRQVLIPAIREIIKQIDLIRRMMYIDPMQGLLDDDGVKGEDDIDLT
jgi:16S rRNA processing protein RimM